MDFPGNLTVGDVIRERAREFGDRAYLVFEDADGAVKSVTYAELDESTRVVALALAERGLVVGDRVLLMVRNSVECVVAMLACARAGFVSVPINTASVIPDVRHVIELVEPRALVTHAEFLETVSQGVEASSVAFGVVVGADGEPQRHLVGWPEVAAPRAGEVETTAASDDLMQILMTSGTTSRPKAVMHTHANRLRSGYRVATHNRLRPDDRSLTPFPAFHVNCIDGTLFAALVSGGTAVLLERFRARRFWEQIRRHRATVVPLLPTVVRALLASPASEADTDHSVRLVGIGLHLTEQEVRDFKDRFGIPAMVTGYGLTEASTGVLQTHLEGSQHYASIGVPLIDREVELRHETGVPVGVGETGEIVIRGVPGRSIMLGYFGDPDATAEAIRDGWLYTGDLAWRDAEGYFYFAGRSKDMIKRSGENIAAQEVEAVLQEHRAIREAAVIGVPDGYRDEAVKAVLITAGSVTVDLAEVQEFCRPRLAAFKIPTIVEIVDELPRGLLGKIDKKALREREDRGSVDATVRGHQ